MTDDKSFQEYEKDNRFHAAPQLDAELQKELDEALGDMSIGDMIAAEDAASAPAAPAGQGAGVKTGRVEAIQGDDIFVDMGGKSQGMLPAAQFADEPLPEIGDLVEFTIEGYDRRDGLLLLSRQGAVLAATWETLEEGQSVEGRVTGHNKGGLELTINGIEAFMPISQIERFRVEELGDYVNQKLQCQVIELDRREGKVVVSRRNFLDLQAEAKREEMWETLKEGSRVKGVVRSIMPYGAFVDIGGVDGLLHVSDMSHSRVDDPKTIVAEGDAIEVQILKIDLEEKRIALGLKQILPDPWQDIENRFPEGQVVTGRITKLESFGAFIELTGGVEGLIPISEMSYERRIAHPKEVVTAGEVVKVRVLRIDLEKKRMSLSIKQVGDDPWIGASVRWPVDSIIDGRVTRTTDFGAFVELTPGVEGLIHVSQLGGGFVNRVEEAISVGQSVQAMVLDVDEEAHRISLSIKAITESPNYTGEPSDASEPAYTPKKHKNPLKGGLE